MRIKSVLALATLLLGLFGAPAHAAALTAADLLEKLVVAQESNSPEYQRSYFKHWIDADKDKCDTRAEVLIQESVKVTKQASGCKVLSGKWLSRYDNKTFTKPTGLDIDHMVPLKEAWESGAFGWTAAQREAFANDLGFQGSLIAVSATANRSKGDKDPATWLPKSAAYTCTYVVTWLQVKYRWSLTIDPVEKAAVEKVLDGCPSAKLFTTPKQMIKVPILPDFEPAATGSDEVQAPSSSPDADLDPRFDSCSAAKAAGFGPYVKGVDPEYEWYRDGDADGTVCE